MKKVIILILAIISLNGFAQEAKKYAIKSGYIKYELTGNTTRTKELWWDDFGQKSCELEKSKTTTKMFGIKNTEEKNMCTVLVKDKFWVADYIAGAGTSGTVAYYQEAQDYASDMTEQEQQEFADELLGQLGGKKLGTENLGSYSCDVIKLLGAKSWIYKGISLKNEAKILGVEANEKYVEFSPNAKVASSKFNPPAGVDYENISAKQQEHGFGGLMSAFGDMENMEDEDDNIIPVNYKFDEFKQVISNCELEGYKSFGAANSDGIYVATFMNGIQTIAITLQADRNVDKDDAEYKSFKRFNTNGHTCRYGKLTEEDGTALLVEYPSNGMILLIVAMPGMSREEMIKIEDKLQF
ncbi:hypothetical protein [Maribellus maritimus]|uniref:hypothetical protein n=1 Tax=Maribellus maritimus TaxID=2870838 RepID=UPI001EEBD689|nr:hypothetical protein [Maribellus maritimus]MCG6188686.1 hypothetical protein [Maribellus maritimus]